MSISNLDSKKSFHIFEASAGSGKTYNLAKEYLYLCFVNFDKDAYFYKRILAITFTNKAVGEMKERILKYLREFSEGVSSNLYNDFKKDFDENMLKSHSKAILHNILHDYSHFSICTIDTFFQQLARSFAIELNIPINATIELNESLLVDKIVNNLIDQIGEHEDKVVNKKLMEFFDYIIGEEKSLNSLETSLASTGKEIYQEDYLTYKESIQQFIKELDETKLQHISKRIADDSVAKQAAQDIIDIFEDPDLKEYINKPSFYNWFLKCSQGNIGNPTDTLQSMINGETALYAKKTKESVKNRIEALRPTIEDRFETIVKFIKYKNSYEALEKKIYAVRLLLKMDELRELIKAKDKIVHISEAKTELAKIITDHSVAPFVYYKLGNRYNYIFIDEFQDTSKVQWHNLKPLSEEVMSKRVVSNVDKTGQTILFGDKKQAIYRFRNGDVRLMDEMTKKNEQNQFYHPENNIIKLDTNYRSKKEVVEFNNTFFKQSKIRERHAENELLVRVYEDSEQTYHRKDGNGYVALHVTDFASKIDDVAEKFNKDIYAIIQQLKKCGYQLNDIAILLRKKDKIPSIIQYLANPPLGTNRKKIACISEESLSLKNNAEVQFLIAMLYFLQDVKDAIALTKIQLYLGKDFSKVKNFDQEKDIWNFFKELQIEFDERDYKKCRNLSLYQQVEFLMDRFDLPNNSFTLTFCNKVFEFSNNKQYAEYQFFEYWEDNDFSIIAPQGNAVNILTVHKSKGLEYPIVIYPKFSSTASGHENLRWQNIPQELCQYMGLQPIGGERKTLINIQKDLQNGFFSDAYQEEQYLQELDEENADYVACTRAKDRLYILLSDKSDKEKEKQVHKLVDDYIDIFVGQTNAKDKEELQNTVKEEQIELELSVYAKGDINEQKSTKKEDDETNETIVCRPTGFYDIPITNDTDNSEKKWGRKVHQYFSQIVTKNDIERVKDKVEKECSTEDKDKIFKNIDIVFKNNENILFGPEGSIVKNEIAIWYRENENAQTKIIDRLVLCPDRTAYIIDYKTGSNHDENEETYKKQVNWYAQLITEMGYKVTIKKLLYINKESDMEFVDV